MWEMANVLDMPSQSSNRAQSVPKLAICCLSQFKEDTGEPSVSAQEISPKTHLL